MPDKRSLVKISIEKIVKLYFRGYFRLVHNIKIEGLENIPKAPGRLIIIANHASLLDGPLLWSFLPLAFKVLVDRVTAQIPYLKPFMDNDYTYQIDPLNSYALKEVIGVVNKGTHLLVFPEGRRTTTGSIMKIYEGTGFIAYKTGAKILPIYIKNAELTVTSLTKGRRNLLAPLTVTIGKVQPPIEVGHLPNKLKKKEAARAIYHMLTDICFAAHNKPATLASKFIELCQENGNRMAFKDITRKEVSYKEALLRAFLLQDYFAGFKEENIGILLPNLTSTVLMFFGLQLAKKVPAFLNYSSGPVVIKQTLELADINTIISSREFLAKIKLDPVTFAGKKVVYIEDLPSQISFLDKLRAYSKTKVTRSAYKFIDKESKNTALLLFTSGSEGVPKGVCLTHENIISNIYQAMSKIDFRDTDFVLNALPIFHSFGLTVGTLLPLFRGARVFLYVSPLHYRVIPEIAYDQNCTILLGTNTFLNGFSKKANPYDFYAMRYIFCGAEALTETVFNKYVETYGIRVMSGYGATECAPVISINSPLEYEYGSVGKVLPGIDYKLVPVEGIDNKSGKLGRLYVKGPNIMKGYLKNEKANHKYLIEDQGWYDTGDIVETMETGFLKIVGRMKRFAKISGEMVSLTAIEDALAGAFGERKEIAIMAVADEKKGEKLIAVVNSQKIELKDIREKLKEKGFSELAHPREVQLLKEIPKLGTGKVDYVKLKELCKSVWFNRGNKNEDPFGTTGR
ncbi:MAG: AMP-binding protein [bacterium]|nr:AMP-binding protein [bacterium]